MLNTATGYFLLLTLNRSCYLLLQNKIPFDLAEDTRFGNLLEDNK